MPGKAQLAQYPWKSLHARGLTDLFGLPRARALVGLINQVNANARVF